MKDPIEPVTRKIGGAFQGFYAILPTLGIALVIFALFVLAAWIARRMIISLLRPRDRYDLGVLLGGFVKWVLILFGLLVVATIVFPSVKPADLLRTLGVGSVAIGFAFKDILQNWLSGLLILYRQPFRRGDQIKSGEFEGTVDAIEARATLIRTYDGQQVVIPNSDIYTRAVTVRTAFDKRCSEYDLAIGYGDDVERTRAVIVAVLRTLDEVERDPMPDAVPWTLDGSCINLRVRWWTDSRRASVVQARGRVIAALKQALAEAGIDLPDPTQVLLRHDRAGAAGADRIRQREDWPAGERPPHPGYRDRPGVERHTTAPDGLVLPPSPAQATRDPQAPTSDA